MLADSGWINSYARVNKIRILVVDDEEGILEVCADTLKRLPETQIVVEQRSERAASRLLAEDFDLLIADVFMPGLNGIELLRQARKRNPQQTALMLMAYPTVETAVECMKLGAADFITKPFLPEDFLATVRRLLDARPGREAFAGRVHAVKLPSPTNRRLRRNSR